LNLFRRAGEDGDLALVRVKDGVAAEEFFPIFASMAAPIASNLPRMRLLVLTGTKSGRCMTEGVWCAPMHCQWVMPVAQCL